MRVQLNTLYVLSEGAYVRRRGETLAVELEKQIRLRVPIRNLESVVVFGKSGISPAALGLCVEQGAAVTFLSRGGRLVARVDAPTSGNVLLRREQFRLADRAEASTELARAFVAGKVQNARVALLRAARDDATPTDRDRLRDAARALARRLRSLPGARSLDAVRGLEGSAARDYFAVFSSMVRVNREAFGFSRRTRRPPRDRTNCLLSFVYGLLLHDCVAALTAAGLDPCVGFLHRDRPARPGLALDLMEEFRGLLADRFVLTRINRRQVKPADFELREGGAVNLGDKARRNLVAAWRSRKADEVRHPLLGQSVSVGGLVFLQAKLLARHIRGDLPAYVPCVLK